MDSGVLAHAASDMNAFTSYSLYIGSDQLHIGDDKVWIYCIYGSSCLATNFNPLILSNIVHVPTIFKSLLSISQLLANNHVYVEFIILLILLKIAQVTRCSLKVLRRHVFSYIYSKDFSLSARLTSILALASGT
jgi:hypothetical protein